MSDVEGRLNAYRPAGPPPDLRARILRAADESPGGIREWLPAVAAAALIAVLSALNYRLHTQLETRLAMPDDFRPVEQWLPDDGGGPR
jgi:hypothetical protein